MRSIDGIVDWLIDNGKEVAERYEKEKCKTSAEIIRMYAMLKKCPGDPGAHGILDARIDEYVFKYKT
jgi:hypothetical protein